MDLGQVLGAKSGLTARRKHRHSGSEATPVRRRGLQQVDRLERKMKAATGVPLDARGFEVAS